MKRSMASRAARPGSLTVISFPVWRKLDAFLLVLTTLTLLSSLVASLDFAQAAPNRTLLEPYPLHMSKLMPNDSSLIDEKISASLLYYAAAGLNVDYTFLASAVESYAKIWPPQDEFQRRRVVEAFTVAVQPKLREIKKSGRFVFLGTARLGEYNFQSKSFPVEVLPPEFGFMHAGIFGGGKPPQVTFQSKDRMPNRLPLDERQAEELLRSMRERSLNVWILARVSGTRRGFEEPQRDPPEIRIEPLLIQLFRPDARDTRPLKVFRGAFWGVDLLRRGKIVLNDGLTSAASGWTLRDATVSASGMTLNGEQGAVLVRDLNAAGETLVAEARMRFADQASGSRFCLGQGLQRFGRNDGVSIELCVHADGAVSGGFVTGAPNPDALDMERYVPGSVSRGGWNTVRIISPIKDRSSAVFSVNDVVVGVSRAHSDPDAFRLRSNGAVIVSTFKVIRLPKPLPDL